VKKSKPTIYTFFLCVLILFMHFISLAQKKHNPKSALKKQPNIIFIVTDDQHRDQFNFLKEGQDEDGNPTNLTPNMDRLVSEGVIFDKSYVSTSVCTPSRYNILTGNYASRASKRSNIKRYQGQTNVTWNVRIDSSTNNIAKELQKNGYFTGGVGKNHVIYSINPHKVPLSANPRDSIVKSQLIENQLAQITSYKKVGFDFAGSIYKGNLPSQYPKGVEDHNMEWIVEAALTFLTEADEKENPFFLYFATTITHGPDKLGSKHKGDPLATPIGFLEKPLEVMPPRETIGKRIEEAGLEQEKTDLLWLDDAIGTLLDKLDAIKELENTVIFFINDHGVEFGKGSLYQGGIETVSFAWGPSYFKNGIRTQQMVSNIDLVPTALELAKINPSENYKIDGKSMVPLLKGKDRPIHSSLYFEIGATRAILKNGKKYLAFKAPENVKKQLEKNGKKTTHLCDKPGGRGSESPALKFYAKNYFVQEQFYDINKDPLEQNNGYKNTFNEYFIKELKLELKKYIDDLPGTFPLNISKPIVKD